MILVLILPKAFVVGGFGVSAILELASGFVSTLAACLLVQCALAKGVYSYSKLTKMVLGKWGRRTIDLVIALAQFSFTVSHISFIIQSMHTTVSALAGTSL